MAVFFLLMKWFVSGWHFLFLLPLWIISSNCVFSCYLLFNQSIVYLSCLSKNTMKPPINHLLGLVGDSSHKWIDWTQFLALADTSTHIHTVRSRNYWSRWLTIWCFFIFIFNPAGRWSIETPSETLPRTHHHQYAVLHSKTNIWMWGGR